MRPISLIPILLCLLLVIVPVTARIDVTGGNIDISKTLYGEQVRAYNYIADLDERISIVEYDLPLNTRVDFTITYGTGSTVSGYMIYEPYTAVGSSTSTVSLGGDTRTEHFVDAQALGYGVTKHVQFSSYGVNKTASPPQPGFTLYAQGYGLFSDEIVFFPVTDLQANLITGITVSSTQPIDITLTTNKADKLSEFVTKTVQEYQSNVLGDVSQSAQNWINLGLSVVGYLYEMILSLFYWLKFFFVDNLVMTVALYITVTMVFAARASRGNIAKFLRTWFRDQVGLIKFILSMWKFMAEMIGTVRGWFRI